MLLSAPVFLLPRRFLADFWQTPLALYAILTRYGSGSKSSYASLAAMKLASNVQPQSAFNASPKAGHEVGTELTDLGV